MLLLGKRYFKVFGQFLMKYIGKILARYFGKFSWTIFRTFLVNVWRNMFCSQLSGRAWRNERWADSQIGSGDKEGRQRDPQRGLRESSKMQGEPICCVNKTDSAASNNAHGYSFLALLILPSCCWVHRKTRSKQAQRREAQICDLLQAPRFIV